MQKIFYVSRNEDKAHDGKAPDMDRFQRVEKLNSLIPAGVLRGTGHSLYPAVATIIGTCCFRIVWICTVFRHYHQLNILYYAFPISWVLTIILITIGFIAKKPDKTF